MKSTATREGNAQSCLLIVRHAQSLANAGFKTEDPNATAITDLGLRQAQCVAGLLEEQPDLVAISSYLRTAQTAAPLLAQYPTSKVEVWPIEEFTYLNMAACARTTYRERQGLRHAYWNRCDAEWIDGPGCESFASFVRRVRQFEQMLNRRPAHETVVAFTHGFVMKLLLWLHSRNPPRAGCSEMADFHRIQEKLAVPNCGILCAATGDDGTLGFSDGVAVSHIPPKLRT